MGVPRQGEIDPEIASAIKAVGIRAEQDVCRIRHHEMFDSPQVTANQSPPVCSHSLMRLKIDSDQTKAFAVRLDKRACLAKDDNAFAREESGDGILSVCPEFVVTKTADNPERRLKAGQRLDYRLLRVRVPG